MTAGVFHTAVGCGPCRIESHRAPSIPQTAGALLWDVEHFGDIAAEELNRTEAATIGIRQGLVSLSDGLCRYRHDDALWGGQSWPQPAF